MGKVYSEAKSNELNALVNGKEKVLFGFEKSGGSGIYLTKPKFDCGWYWGFGYLGNRNNHYHLSGFANGRNINMYDALIADYTLNPKIEKELWKFCELMQSAYTIRAMADMLHIGGSHYTENPCKAIICKDSEYKRLVEVVLPAIFNEINAIFE